MSLESGRKLGLISSLLMVILPIVSIVVFAGFILSVISSAMSITGGGTVPTETIWAALTGFGVSFAVIGVLAVIAVILFVVAMYYLSHYYNERGIFTNIIYAIILYIVVGVVSSIVQFILIWPALGSISQNTDPSAVFGSGFFTVSIALAIVGIVVMIVVAVLVMRGLNLLAERSGVDSFKTAGTLVLIGVLLLIIAVGLIILWIAVIFAAIGFYRLKPLPPPAAAAPAYTNQPLTVEQRKICPYCGAENKIEAVFCKNCGKPI